MYEAMTEITQPFTQSWFKWQAKSVSWLESLAARQFDSMQGYQALLFQRLQALGHIETEQWWEQVPHWQVESWSALSQQLMQDAERWEALGRQLNDELHELVPVLVQVEVATQQWNDQAQGSVSSEPERTEKVVQGERLAETKESVTAATAETPAAQTTNTASAGTANNTGSAATTKPQSSGASRRNTRRSGANKRSQS